MNKLEYIGLENLEKTLFNILDKASEDKDSDRICKNVIPFLLPDMRKAIDILRAIKENNPTLNQ